MVAIGLSTLVLVSCDTKDPGQAEEVMRLKQENRSLAEKLKAAQEETVSSVGQSEGEVTQLRENLAAAEATLAELKNRFDRKRLEISFASAVSDFKQETLKKFPGSSIKQLTMHEMVMPSDHPFSSGLTMTLRNESGTNKEVHVKALGNIEGEWSFQKVSADQLAANKPEQGVPQVAPPPSRPPVTAAKPKPRPSNPGVTRIPSGGRAPSGKVYRIDWGD